MTLRWGILSTGNIARTFAQAVAQSKSGVLAAVGSRTAASAQQFANEFGIDQAHDSYAALIDDEQVDALYIATPHTEHVEATLAALEAGKHVLCEKPMGLNHAQAMAMVQAARDNNVFLMEAFMYRLYPQTQRLLQLIRGGAIGEVHHLSANFGYHAPFDPASRLFANELAGGGIMDVGCYPMSFARLIANAEIVNISASGNLGDTGVDEQAFALLQFENGTTAQIGTAVSLSLDNEATIYGSKGTIRIKHPWTFDIRTPHWQFELQTSEGTESMSGPAESPYVIEVDHVAECVEQSLVESPYMSWEDTLGNALALDRWRDAIGLQFQEEHATHHRGPLRGALRTPNQEIGRANITNLNKPVSRLVMGCDNQPSMSHASVMWDDFFEAGGNCFDTAHIYGGGTMEAYLGHWHQQRRVREDLVIIGKGAHTPHNAPEHIAPQLDVSLDRLQTDYVDVYFLHRDNTDIPVDEFASALNDEVQRGRIRVFGGSNWTLDRTRAINEYASQQGVQGFAAISNNFSLALMVERIWPGIETSTSQDWREYLTTQQMALMPWSSQARGFFTPWADEVRNAIASENTVITTMQPTMDELRRVWFSDTNFARRDRAQALADRYGVEMINIALAYVLNQAFPTFALIGPRVLAETRSCIDALNLELSDDEIRYLEAD